MLSREKGLSTRAILVLVSALMFAGFMGVLLTNSPLSQAILEGANKTERATDYTIDIKNKNDMSDLAMFVYHRASNDGCKESGGKGPTVAKQNSGSLSFPQGWSEGSKYSSGGYPYLKDTYLGQFPKCYGAKSGALRGVSGTSRNTGDDMEGIFSREKFVVKGDEPIPIGDEVKNGRDDTWLESNFLVGVKKSFEAASTGTCGGLGEYKTIGDQVAIFFDVPKVPDNRGNWYTANERPYCGNGFRPKVDELYGRMQKDQDAAIILCPGDEGYVQMNKNGRGMEQLDPTYSGEAGETGTNTDQQWPYIEITELGDNCVGKSSETISVENVERTYVAIRKVKVDVSVQNNQKADRFRVEIWSTHSNGGLEKSKEIQLGANEDRTLSFSVIADNLNPSFGLACDIQIRLSKRNKDGSWDKVAGSTEDISKYLDGCQHSSNGLDIATGENSLALYGKFAPGPIDDLEKVNPTSGPGPTKYHLKVSKNVINEGQSPEKFAIQIYDMNGNPLHGSNSLSPWTKIPEGGRKEVSRETTGSNYLSSMGCQVQVKLVKQRFERVVDERTVDLGPVKSGC